MAVRIVTDSVSDLPPEVAKELGITVIPLNVRFGEPCNRHAYRSRSVAGSGNRG